MMLGSTTKISTGFIKGKYLIKLIENLSNGEYTINDYDKHKKLYLIENIATGEKHHMKANYILQELRRPTRSKLLPLKKQKLVEVQVKPKINNELISLPDRFQKDG